MSTPENDTYSIQQVSLITGLSKQLIRKWEERYHLVKPKRLDNRYRVYSHEDINTFLKAKSLVDQGNSIKQAVLLLQNGGLPNGLEHRGWEPVHLDALNSYVLDLLHAGTNYNEAEMNRLVHQAYHHYGLHDFIHSIAIPFLREVGQRWEKGQWGEFQESLASLTIRDFLIQLRRNFKHDEEAPILLGSCLPLEQHEIPVHLILLQALLKGWKVAFLGASPSPRSIEATVRLLKPKKVVLSALTTISFEGYPDLLQTLDDFAYLHGDTEFFLGGPGSLTYCKGKQLKAITVTNEMEEIFLT